MKNPIVFVVDDDESVCKALKRLMKSVGIKVRTLSSAENFLNQGCQNVLGCLILDVKMPGMSGLVTDAQNRNHGLGNIQFQGFFSPKDKVGDWILGFGPYLEFPTNSGPDGRFGSDNWSAGPAFVALKMDGPWVYGSLISQLWSYHGNDPEVNITAIQPFVSYNMKDGWYLSSSPVITANWSAADSDDRWTIPIGGGFGRVFKIGKQPVNASIKAYHNLQSPRTGSDWQLQFQIQFLFPK